MSKVTDIEVRVGVTKQLPSYQSARLDYSVRIQPQEGVNIEKELTRLKDLLQEQIKIDIESIKP